LEKRENRRIAPSRKEEALTLQWLRELPGVNFGNLAIRAGKEVCQKIGIRQPKGSAQEKPQNNLDKRE